MRSDPRMYEFTSAVVDDNEHIQCSKPNSLNREEITRPDLVSVLTQELLPTGGGRSTVWTPHVSGNRSGTYSKAKTCQFRLDSALHPKGRLRAPDKEFSRAMRRMSSRSSRSIFLRPVPGGVIASASMLSSPCDASRQPYPVSRLTGFAAIRKTTDRQGSKSGDLHPGVVVWPDAV